MELSWYSTITKLINNFGTGNYNRTSINVNQNLKHQFREFWSRQKTASPKLEFYNQIKSEFKREEYLKIGNSAHRSAITKLRISAHKLNIETGRYTDPITPREQRICEYCQNILQNTHVESEIHAILFCPLYIKPRIKFHASTYNSIIEALRIISHSEDHHELTQLGKFCFELQDLNKAYKNYIKEDSN